MNTDVLVIGGGALGASVAYHLKMADPSIDVTVVERDPTYELASTPRAAGGFRRLFSLPENIALSQYSIDVLAAFPEVMAVDGTPADIGFRRNGYLFIVPPGDVRTLAENFAVQRDAGCDVVWMEPDALKERWPSMNVDDLGAGVHSPEDGWLDPHSVLMAYRNKARSLGATFVADEVVSLAAAGSSVTGVVLRSGQTIAAAHVVNAAGAWAKQICEMLDVAIPIEPLKRYEHYFECQDPIEPLPYIKDPERLAFRPEGHGYSGGVPTLAQPRGYDFTVDGDYFEQVVWPALAKRFPQFERTICRSTMPGLYDQNEFDASPIIGPGAGGYGNLHLLAGFSGHGLMHAPGCGRAVAELLTAGAYQTIDLTRFGWQRIADGTPVAEQGII